MNTLEGITVIGLTGQSGAGKSTVSEIFSACGIPVIDCDKIAHRVSGFPDFLKDVSKVYPDCVDGSGLLRKKLGAVVFNDRAKLREYEKIIFPYITAEIFKEIRMLKQSGERLVILDAPTLFESGMDSVCTEIISVIAPFDVKLRRVLERDNIPVEFARSRLSSQISEKFFYDRSDTVIVNDSSLEVLTEKAKAIAGELKERFNA